MAELEGLAVPVEDISEFASPVNEDISAFASPVDERPPGAKISEKIQSNPFYEPSIEEFKAYRQFKKGEKHTVGEYLGAAGEGFLSYLGNAAKSIYGLAKSSAVEGPGKTLNTAVEGIARGTMDTGILARQGMDKLAGMVSDESKQEFATKRASELLGEPKEGSLEEHLQRWNRAGDLKNFPEPIRKQIESEYEDYKTGREFERFKANREIEKLRAQISSGNQSILPDENGEIDRSLAENIGGATDLTDVATFGGGSAARSALKNINKAIAANALENVGKGIAKTGEVAGKIARIPENAAFSLANKFTDSAEAAEKVRANVAGKVLSAAAIPAVIPAATVETAGNAIQAIGKSAGQTSRSGLFQRIAEDTASPTWMRKSAAALSAIDPAIREASGLTGSAVQGAAGGAVVGGGVGYALSGGDPMAAAGGAGGGLAGGALGGVSEYIASKPSQRAAMRQADLATWMNGKSDDQIANLKSLNLSESDALKYADLEKLAPELKFHYLSGDQLEKQIPGAKNTYGLRQGNDIYVNTTAKNKETLFHEVFHALEAQDFGQEKLAKIDQALFNQTTPDGRVISEGVYTAKDLQTFKERYLAQSKGTPVEARWNQLEAQAKAGNVASGEQLVGEVKAEIRAEEFKRMLSGSSSDTLPRISGVKRRAIDSLLLADKATKLGALKARLEGLGVKFDKSDMPVGLLSGLGTQINTGRQTVDAALRDYVRARKKVFNPLNMPETDESARIAAIPTSEILGKGGQWVKDRFGSLDIWNRDTQGKPTSLRTNEQVSRALEDRAGWIADTFKKLPTPADQFAFQDRENGQWGGRYFSDEQMNAIKSAPGVFPAEIVAKIDTLNRYLKANHDDPSFGNAVLLDYNAAIEEGRGGKKRYAGLSPTSRIGVPYEIYMSKRVKNKGGNFLIKTLDLTALESKLRRWQSDKPKAVSIWGGDYETLHKDVLQVLKNKVAGNPAALDLSPDPTTAIAKRNAILDLLNFNPDLTERASTDRQKDRIIRDRRIDRINKITPVDANAPFNLDSYYRIKRVNKPDPIQALPIPQNLRDKETIKVAQDQAAYSFARKLPGLKPGTGIELARSLYKQEPVKAVRMLNSIGPEVAAAIAKEIGSEGMEKTEFHLSQALDTYEKRIG